MIDVRPDPAHPHGGYAVFVMDSSSLPEDEVLVNVFDKFRQHYLGDTGFQPTKYMFGPYGVTRKGDVAEILVGSEIVNQIEEYANLRLQVGSVTADVSWPDDVVPAAGALPIGGISVVRDGAATSGSPLSGSTRAATGTPQLSSQEVSAPEPEKVIPVDPEPASEARGGSRLPLVLAGGVAVIVAAAAAFYFLQEDAAVPVPETPKPVVVPDPSPSDPCSAEALTLLAGDGFAAVEDQLVECGSAVSADDALLIVESAAEGGDPAALTLFGQLYDSAAENSIETSTGLTFGDDPARAAEYYARAREAGSSAATPLSEALCSRLSDAEGTLERGAFEDYCSP